LINTLIVTLDLNDLYLCNSFQTNVSQFLFLQVLSGLYAGTDSGITAQHLEWVHSFSQVHKYFYFQGQCTCRVCTIKAELIVPEELFKS